ALVWSREPGSREDQLRLVGLVWRLWWVRGEFAEGRKWLESALERGVDADQHLRALALKGAAGLAWAQSDFDRAEELAEAASTLFGELGDLTEQSGALNILGHVALSRGTFEKARRYFERTRVLAERPADVALAALNLGTTAHLAGDFGEGERLYEAAR